MDEKEIIKQLKGLRAVTPNKDWVLLSKEKLLKQGSTTGSERAGWIFAPLGRPALVLSTVALAVAVVLVGGLFYFNQKAPVAYENIEGLLTKILSQGKNQEQIVSSLGELQAKLEDIKGALNGLKNAKDQGQALAVTEVVKATAKRGEEVMSSIKKANKGLSKQVLASLVEVEDVSKELGEKSSNLQQELFASCLNALKQVNLSAEDEARLQKAEEEHNEIIIMKLYNKYLRK